MLISHRTSRLLAAGTLVLAAPVLASCSTEMATDKIYTQAAGVNDRSERVDVLNAVIVSSEDGKGTFVATLANNEVPQPGDAKGALDDQLVGLTVDGQSAEFRPVTIPGGGSVVLATPNADILDAARGIKVTGDFTSGDFVTVVLTFANARKVTMEIPVHANVEGSVFAGQDGEATTPAGPADEGGHEEEAEGH